MLAFFENRLQPWQFFLLMLAIFYISIFIAVTLPTALFFLSLANHKIKNKAFRFITITGIIIFHIFFTIAFYQAGFLNFKGLTNY